MKDAKARVENENSKKIKPIPTRIQKANADEDHVMVKGLKNAHLKDGYTLKVGEEIKITKKEWERLEKDGRGLAVLIK